MVLFQAASVLRLLPTAKNALTRNAHFLAAVPLKKEGHSKQLDPTYFDGKKKFYDKIGKDKGVEVVWISRDKHEDDLEEYYQKLPDWAYIPFGDGHIKEFLQKYDVKTIPAVKLVNEDGAVLSEDGRKDVEAITL